MKISIAPILFSGMILVLFFSLQPQPAEGGIIPAAPQAVFTVNSEGDEGDAYTGDGICDTTGTLNDPYSGICTLRAAIEEANRTPEADSIFFDISNVSGVPVISLGSPLPQINYPVAINGTTQSGGWVELNLMKAGSPAHGLEFWSGSNSVKGLVFCGLNGHAILLVSGDGNTISGNLIGIKPDNVPCYLNGNGIRIMEASDNNLIGGVTEAERNVISNSVFSGIYVMAGSSGNLIQGNYIGTDSDGMAAQGNDLAGVHIEGNGNTVGGTTGVSGDQCSGACNLISGNQYGVFLSGGQAVSNTVQGNFIGTNLAGTAALGNSEAGVLITDGASENLIGGVGGDASLNTIGGVIAPTANLIAFNGGAGVFVLSGSGNTVRRNLIYENHGLGIDLGVYGVTANDAGDVDSGANGLQNFPELTSLVVKEGIGTVKGVLKSGVTAGYTLEFFANPGCDPSLHGEGSRYLETITVTTDVKGDATFTFTTPLSETEKVAATATDASGNTSEFSKCVRHTERVAFNPAVGITRVFSDAQGDALTVEIPAGAITYTEMITLAYAPIEEVVAEGFSFANRAFELSLYMGDTLLSGMNFSPPLEVTLHYSDEDVAGMDEEALMLRYWDGATWSDEGIQVLERDTVNDRMLFAIAHLSEFALFAPSSNEIYLPIMFRNGQ